jgi:hypothetical protein
VGRSLLCGEIAVEIETSQSLRFNIGMKTDLYTKVVLTIIAACLLGLVFRDVPTVTTEGFALGVAS